MKAEDLPSKDLFVSWLQAKGDDPTEYDINKGEHCLLTQFLRQALDNKRLETQIDDIVLDPGSRASMISSPEWMFNFQANCIYAPGWSIYVTSSGHRSITSPHKRESTLFTAKAALEVLLSC